MQSALATSAFARFRHAWGAASRPAQQPPDLTVDRVKWPTLAGENLYWVIDITRVSMMNVYLRNQVTALFLFLPATTAMVAFPMAAMAQPTALELRSLQVSSDAELNSGAQLGFSVEGTPGGQAHLRIDGVSRDIGLKEAARGLYTGNYTIMRQDVVSQASALHVTLQEGGRNIVSNYAFPPSMAGGTPAADVQQFDKQSDKLADKLKIEHFTVVPIKQIEPGVELHFSLSGARGAKADVQIPGLANHVQMREVHPGVYEGAYTIRKQDQLIPSRPIGATLAQGQRSVKSKQIKTWVTNTQSPFLRVSASEPCDKPSAPKTSKSSTRAASKPSAPPKPKVLKSLESSPHKTSKSSAREPSKSSPQKTSKSSARMTTKSSVSHRT